MNFFRSQIFTLMLTLLASLGLGLAYSWLISPVEYVDASPAILRADYKDQYRIVIAAAYASAQNLPRARARLEQLGDPDPLAELSAQAQRMLAANESFERVRPLAQLAADLEQGYASIIPTNTKSIGVAITPIIDTPLAQEPVVPLETPLPTETPSFELTPFSPFDAFTSTPRTLPTPTSQPALRQPFTLIGQEPICDSELQQSLLEIILLENNRRQIPGIKVSVAWAQGEDRFFTGFKPELGEGYADFLMEAGVSYSVTIENGGAFIPSVSAPTCSDSSGAEYPGGLLLTFQR